MNLIILNSPRGGLASCKIEFNTNGCIGFNFHHYKKSV